MKTFIVCLCVVGALVVLVFAFKSARMKAEYSRQALRLTDHELGSEIIRLWAETGEKFSFKKSVRLNALEKETKRRNRKF